MNPLPTDLNKFALYMFLGCTPPDITYIQESGRACLDGKLALQLL